MLRFRVQRQPGAEHHEINALGKLQQGRLAGEGDAPSGRFLLRRKNDLRPLVGQERRHGGGGGEARITAAGFQERQGGQVRGAVITARSGDEQRIAERALVALRVARRQRQGGIDRHLQTGRLDHGRRKGEGRDVQPAAVPKAGPQQVAALGQAEGDGEIGPYRGAHHRAGVAVHAGGHVEAEHGLAAAVDPLDDFTLQTRHRTGQPRAQQGIHNDVAGGEISGQMIDFLERFNLDRQAGENLPVLKSCPAQAILVTDHDHLQCSLGSMQASRHHEAVATVVANAADDDKTLPGQPDLTAKHHAGGLAGVLHEQRLGNAEVLNGLAVQRPHLCNTADFHTPATFHHAVQVGWSSVKPLIVCRPKGVIIAKLPR